MVFACLSRFRLGSICHRLRPVATAGLRKGSILCCHTWLRELRQKYWTPRSAGSPRGATPRGGQQPPLVVVIALESGELSIRPHVCRRIDKRSAGVANRRLGVHQGYHLVVLGDELSWLERRVVESRCKTTKPAYDCLLASERSGVWVVVGIAGIHPLDVVRHHLGKRRHVAPTESLIRTLDEAGVLFCRHWNSFSRVSDEYLTRGDSVHSDTVSSGGIDERGRRRQRHRAGVVLAEAEEVEADLFREVDGFEHVPDRLRGRP